MKISVITPTYNSGKSIAYNVKSILNQTVNRFEQIIVDNKSTDETLRIVSELYSKADKNERLKILCEADSGISDAFNKGIKASTGEIITFLNSDDEYADINLFSEIFRVFENDDVLFSHGNIFFYDPVRGSVLKTPKLKTLEDGMIFFHPTMFFRKEIFDKFGLFDTHYKYAMDFEMLCRALSHDGNFLKKGLYLNKRITKVNFGGKSWTNPLESLNETKIILKSYGMWSTRARFMLFINELKTIIIFAMVKSKLRFLLIPLRKFKWKYLRINR